MRSALLVLMCAILASCAAEAEEHNPNSALPAVLKTYRHAASGSSSLSVIYNFSSYEGGGSLTPLGGLLYGVSNQSVSPCSSCGGIYSTSAAGDSHLVYSFNGSKYESKGENPEGPLAVIGGNLYGVTQLGGHRGGCCGTVFRVSPSGKYRVVFAFPEATRWPEPGLTALNGVLYGATQYALFSMTITGQERILHHFGGVKPPDGVAPNGSFVSYAGKYWGTTSEGGENGLGTIYTFTSTGNYRVIYSFQGGYDGGTPSAGLTVLNGAVYGTTNSTIFTISASGKLTTLHRFDYPGGRSPQLLTAAKGALYGSTLNGPDYNAGGTLFKMTPAGLFTPLHVFGPNDVAGVSPSPRLAFFNGLLYGTTFNGGTSNWGTIFTQSP